MQALSSFSSERMPPARDEFYAFDLPDCSLIYDERRSELAKILGLAAGTEDMMGKSLAERQPDDVRRKRNGPVGTEGGVERPNQRVRPNLGDQFAMITRTRFNRTGQEICHSLVIGNLGKWIGRWADVRYSKRLANGGCGHGNLNDRQQAFQKLVGGRTIVSITTTRIVSHDERLASTNYLAFLPRKKAPALRPGLGSLQMSTPALSPWAGSSAPTLRQMLATLP